MLTNKAGRAGKAARADACSQGAVLTDTQSVAYVFVKGLTLEPADTDEHGNWGEVGNSDAGLAAQATLGNSLTRRGEVEAVQAHGDQVLAAHGKKKAQAGMSTLWHVSNM